jgi:mono/diheme cytochrome c family protein
MTMRSLLAGVFVVLAATAVSAQSDKVDPDHAAKMARGLEIFKQHVRPLMAERCVKCHGGKETEAGFDLTDRDPLLKGGESGPAVLIGNAKNSLMVKLLRHEKEPKMPKGFAKLPAETVNQIIAWIDSGAPYDKPLIEKIDPKAWIKKRVPDDAKKHWAFQPLQRVEPPKVQDEAWCRTPIDQFIRAKQEAAGVTPNGPAERRKLIRRVYFDLTGLPPTPAEVEAFVADTATNAWEKVVDHLLKSPHYGERWARHWLDLVRFGESHGFEHDYDRPTAYHYRDFVIRALNDDLPYDTFVKWQLAGDEYAPQNPLAWMATGYLAAGVHSTQITKNEVEKQRYDELDDILATTGTAMLGLTVGCARCHDHKFDPFPQADYYRMLSTFTTTVRSEYDLDLNPAAYRTAKAAFDAKHQPLVAALVKFEKEQLPARFAAWEKANKAPPAAGWLIPDVAEMRSQGGATLTKQDDGSVLVGGTNPPIEALRFTLHTDLTDVAAIRVEALTHPSLVKGGPGRASSGNFALTNFHVTAAPKSDPNKTVPVKLIKPRATFEQKGLPVAAAIDADPVTSGWAIDPQVGRDHAAAFQFEKPVSFPGGTVINVLMQFQNNAGHGMGRPRLSLATSADVDLTAAADGEAFRRLLALEPAKRKPEETALLLKWYRRTDSEWQKLNKAAQDSAKRAPKPNTVKALVSGEGLPPVRLHTQGDDFLPATHFLRRGDCDQKDAVAQQGFLQVLMPAADAEKRWHRDPPAGSKTSYRRTSFAEWLTDVDAGAGRLLARVIVNRLWQHHLGRGLVATPSDFGTRGEPPTHPELLDWLASELIARGWKLKEIHKLILTSAVYMQDGRTDELRLKSDRENKLVWHLPTRRLEAEAIRDGLLAVSGTLDDKMYGPGTLDESSHRRSIYFTVKRSKLIPMMVVFDAPEALVGVGDRPATTIAPQALMLMNNPQVRTWAKGLAKRVAADSKTPIEAAVRSAYAWVLSRPPTADELADAVAFVQSQTDVYRKAGKSDARELALTDFCQTVMCLNEFVFVE